MQEGGSRGTECKPARPQAGDERAWDPGDTEKPPRWPRAVSRRLDSHTAAAGSGRTLGQRRPAVSPHGQEGPGKWGRGGAKPQPGLLGEGPRQALRVMAPGGSARFSLLWGSLEDHTRLSGSWTTAAEKPSRPGPGAARRTRRTAQALAVQPPPPPGSRPGFSESQQARSGARGPQAAFGPLHPV